MTSRQNQIGMTSSVKALGAPCARASKRGASKRGQASFLEIKPDPFCPPFGTDRQRFQTAEELQTLSGVAPVTKRSGKTHLIHRRWACPKFLLQTFHEFAHCSCKKSIWAKAFYLYQRSRGKGHHAALRALAFKWIRILFRCWQTSTPYSEDRYLQALRRQQVPLLAFLPPAHNEPVENLSTTPLHPA